MKFTSAALFHAFGLIVCLWTSGKWTSHMYFSFLIRKGRRRRKKTHTQHAKKAGMTVRENGCWGKKAIVTGNYLNRVKIKKRPTTQSVSRIRAVFSRLANYSVCINFGLFLLSFMFLLFILF